MTPEELILNNYKQVTIRENTFWAVDLKPRWTVCFGDWPAQHPKSSVLVAFNPKTPETIQWSEFAYGPESPWKDYLSYINIVRDSGKIVGIYTTDMSMPSQAWTGLAMMSRHCGELRRNAKLWSRLIKDGIRPRFAAVLITYLHDYGNNSGTFFHIPTGTGAHGHFARQPDISMFIGAKPKLYTTKLSDGMTISINVCFHKTPNKTVSPLTSLGRNSAYHSYNAILEDALRAQSLNAIGV